MPDATHKPPIGEVEGKKREVESMFDAIAPKYDLLNRVLSLGIDKVWRTQAVKMAGRALDRPPRRILDVATGTADLAVEALKLGPDEVIGVDIAEEMLAFGREKLKARGLDHRITLQRGDAENLEFEDGAFDAVLVAFGVRNFENLGRGLAELRRVLRPGGVLVVLEFSRPRAFPMKQLYGFYSSQILPRVGRAVSGDSGAYAYLPESIQAFPDGDDFLRVMREAGFEKPKAKRLTFGVASLYRGVAG
ncbi:MAG: bifunctional demethylmenaquinone methyltransferase/2-methoxy-6-polyprenyl-1,4-benzoquinol methylase UbiE [Rhodothermales bacterium]